MSSKRRIALCMAVTSMLLAAHYVPASAAPQPTAFATIKGTILDQHGSLPVPGASVDLYLVNVRVAHSTSDSAGHFVFAVREAGDYNVLVRARGYESTRSAEAFLNRGDIGSLDVPLKQASVNDSSAHEIGRVVTTATQGTALQTTAVISHTVDTGQLLRENYVRVGDVLNTLPGVNLRSQSSAVGDDIFVDIRGVGATETQALLDGHPIGPIGISPSTFFNGAPTAFDYQDTPYFALRNVQVTYGSGALGLYGTDSIGGVVDMQTLEPTSGHEATLQFGLGSQGKSFTAIQATGTAGKFGYAVLNAVQGTWGNFPAQQVYQSGLNSAPPNQVPAAQYTYQVTADYLLRNDLVKFRYALSPATALSVTGYSGTSWDDKSGNGDNDFNTYQQQLYNAQKGAGQDPSCPNGYNIAASGLSPQCITPGAYARYVSGPAGGGPGPFQAIRNQDYHARLTSALGKHQLAFDTFFDNYALDYNRNCNSVNLLSGGCTNDGGFDTTFTRSFGILASDDIVLGNNDFGFGFFNEHQTITGDTFIPSIPALVANQELNVTDANYFVRDAFTPPGKLSYFFNGWVKRSSVTHLTNFDPRLSVVLRPDGSDVFRLTGGRSTAAPAPSLRFGTFNLNNTPANLNPNCNGLTSVGGVGNPAIGPESGTDIEVAYGHRFRDDSQFQLAFYNTNLTDAIFSLSEPASALGAGAIPPSLLSQYLTRISTFCPNLPNPTLGNLSVSTVANAASARYRGVELTGRTRIDPHFYVDYGYDIQSAVRIGVPDSILMANFNIINGSQVLGIPLHKASLGFDVTDRHGFEARLDGYYIGNNNGLNRPAYGYADASLSKVLSRRTSINVGVSNIFGNAVDTYGRIGLGQFNPENAFGTDQNAFDQGSERFGLPPPRVLLSLTERL